MPKSHEIKNLEDVVSSLLGENRKLLDYNTKQLTAAGENYGSLMLALELIVEVNNNGRKSQEIIPLVAKLPPPNEWIREMFNTPVTFKKESGLYNSIIPTLQEFQREQGVEEVMDFFPKYYGSRLSLDNSDTVDEHAIILLENLKYAGYETGDRMVGFDFETTKLILQDLAVFHAVPIALKLKKPKIFDEKIKPYLIKATAFDLEERISLALKDKFIEVIEENDKCKPHIAKVSKALEKSKDAMNAPLPGSEPFATICHCDYWVNNTMLKYEDGKPVKNALVDFQILEYGSPGNDIIFFLFSSVQRTVLDNNYEELIKIYYDSFIATLKQLHCDIGLFSYDKYLEELRVSATDLQFYHTLSMYKPIFLTKEGIKDLSEASAEGMLSMEGLGTVYYERTWFLVQDFVARKWI